MPQAPTTVPSQISGPRLPMLTIQPFHGDMCSSMSFWEQFNGAVHTNRALTATEKFHYLRNYLSGEAAAAIAGLPTTEACYESAVQLLKDRFGGQEQYHTAAFSNLRELRPVTSYSEDKELRRLYDCVTLNVRCLNVLDVPTSSFSAMLYDVLLEALPKEIVLAFHRHGRLQGDTQGAVPSALVEATNAATSCRQLENSCGTRKSSSRQESNVLQ
ncbi:uncharacterized protein LOC144146227 [Haemaphysalis longicornis]